MRGVIVIQKEEENSSEFSLKADSSKVFKGMAKST